MIMIILFDNYELDKSFHIAFIFWSFNPYFFIPPASTVLQFPDKFFEADWKQIKFFDSDC